MYDDYYFHVYGRLAVWVMKWSRCIVIIITPYAAKVITRLKFANYSFLFAFEMLIWRVLWLGLELREVSGGVVVAVFVKPNSGQFQLRVEGDMLVVLCRESPVKGRVNKELIKELSKIFKKRIKIVAGFTSKQKKMLVKDISKDETSVILSKYVSK